MCLLVPSGENKKNETVRECPWLCPFNYVFHSRWQEKTEGRCAGKALGPGSNRVKDRVTLGVIFSGQNFITVSPVSSSSYPPERQRNKTWFCFCHAVAEQCTQCPHSQGLQHSNLIFFNFMCMLCLRVCLCTVCPWRLEEGIGSYGDGVTGGCEQPHGCWEPTWVLRKSSQCAEPTLQAPDLQYFKDFLASDFSTLESPIRVFPKCIM